eukprot:10170568-Alexandrium_andersonii.AAC.1
MPEGHARVRARGPGLSAGRRGRARRGTQRQGSSGGRLPDLGVEREARPPAVRHEPKPTRWFRTSAPPHSFAPEYGSPGVVPGPGDDRRPQPTPR